jgi:hypothetical protein
MGCDPGEHPRPDLFSIAEREDGIWPVRPVQDAMGTSPPTFDNPADAK